MNVLVISVHPDDETLGCGGTMLRHAAEGDSRVDAFEADGQVGNPERLQRFLKGSRGF